MGAFVVAIIDTKILLRASFFFFCCGRARLGTDLIENPDRLSPNAVQIMADTYILRRVRSGWWGGGGEGECE